MKDNSLVKLTQKLLADGNYFFTREFAAHALGISDAALRLRILRLKKKGEIFSLWRGFFMIVPAEFMHMGTLPPMWLIDPLMKHLGHDYYVGLLSSSSIYGATQQQPQIFQIICNAQVPTIELSRGSIQFHRSQTLSTAFVENVKTPTSYARVASKEQTTLDLVRFYKVCGYFSNIAAILNDICVDLDVRIFRQVLENEKSPSHLQRLGYILETLGFDELADITQGTLGNHPAFCYRKLRPDLNKIGARKNSKWKLIINDKIEVDE